MHVCLAQDFAQCPCYVLPIFWRAFGAHLDVGASEQPSKHVLCVTFLQHTQGEKCVFEKTLSLSERVNMMAGVLVDNVRYRVRVSYSFSLPSHLFISLLPNFFSAIQLFSIQFQKRCIRNNVRQHIKTIVTITCLYSSPFLCRSFAPLQHPLAQ